MLRFRIQRVLAVYWFLAAFAAAVAAAGGLGATERGAVRLGKFRGPVNEVVRWRGYLWVRSAALQSSVGQRLERFTPQGRHRGSLSLSDRGFAWFVDLGAGPDGLYCLDARGRVAVVDENLAVRRTAILRGDHPYPYYPFSLAFAGKGRVLVAGCYPIHQYIDRGCLEVHRFALPDFRYVDSSLTTPPVSHPLPLTNYVAVAHGPDGTDWAWGETEPLVWFRKPTDGVWRRGTYDRFAFSPGKRPREGGRYLDAYRRGPRVKAVAFLGARPVVAVYVGAKNATQLVEFGEQGKAVRVLQVDGKVVGAEGKRVFALRGSPGRWSVVEFALEEQP